MNEIISFFSQYENTLYLILGLGLLGFGVRFYLAWRELRGSVFGLEQISAQRRLNNAAIGMFLLVLMGFLVFSLVTFVEPGLGVLGANTQMPAVFGTEGSDMAGQAQTTQTAEDVFSTATPLPTVEVNPDACMFEEDDPNKISITSPRPNEEVRGLVEVVGVIDVEDFGFYKIEIAPADTGIWLGISVGEAQVPEETELVVFDSAFYPPGNYILQLVVSTHDVEEYEPCRVPIRISPTE
jgi:hypothetical protein